MIPCGKKIYLCSPDLRKKDVLNGLRTNTVDFHPQVKGYSELSFEVDRYVLQNGKQILSNGYEYLKPYMYLFLEDIGYFIMDVPETSYDGNQEYKSIVAYSAEKEFEGRDWVGIKINCGTPDSMEYSNTDSSNIDKYGFAIQYVTMVNYSNHNLSFLHQILQKAIPKWSIGYISPQIMDAKIPAIEVDSENLYAVMTSEVAPRLSCLFVFDYYNFTINVYHKDSLDINSDIFISFRNLQKSVQISSNNDSVYTRFSVQGDEELEFRDVNYGDNTIINLDYFLGEPYMSDNTAVKYRNWLQLREDNRVPYINYVKARTRLAEQRDERIYRVPSDASYWTSWDNMSEEGLDENLKYYNDLLEFLQVGVDDRDDSEKYDWNHNYLPVKDGNHVNHAWYEDKLYSDVNAYNGYYTYREIVEYIIPYIRMAKRNIGKIDENKEKPTSLVNENWELYGLAELEGMRDSYEEQMKVLDMYSEDWDKMTVDERRKKGLNYADDDTGVMYESTAGRKEYKRLKKCLGDENTQGTILYQLKKLNDEINDIVSRIDEIDAITNEYAELMMYNASEEALSQMTHLDSSLIESRRQSLFTSKELLVIEGLLKDTDYVNSNILATSILTIDEKFDIMKDLLNDSQDKLSEVSQPQYKFSVSLENFFYLANYQSWANEFLPSTSKVLLGMLRFIMVSLRDDYAIKLRVIGYRWNPCEVTDELTLEFSNMITTKSGRSDITELLNQENYRGSKNSIRIGTGSANSAQEYCSALMEILKNNTSFVTTIKSLANETKTSTDVAAVQGIAGEYVSKLAFSASEINVKNIVGENEEFNQVFTSYLSPNLVATKMMATSDDTKKELTDELFACGEETLKDMTAETIKSAEINVTQLSGQDADFNTLFSNYLSSDLVTTKVLNADQAKLKELTTEIIQVGEDGLTQLTKDTIKTVNIDVKQIVGEQADFQDLFTERLDADLITTKIINADEAQVQSLSAEIIKVGKDGITQISNDTIKTANIDASQITGDSGTFNELFTQHLDADIVATKVLNADDANIRNLRSSLVTSDAIVTGLINATDGQFENLSADNAFMKYLEANLVTAGTITTEELYAKLANIDVLNTQYMTADTAFISSLQSLTQSSATSVINDAYIYNAVANKISVGDLKAGNIVLGSDVEGQEGGMQIISKNGAMVMNGTALQIRGKDKDGNDYVGIQLGYDTQENPSLILRNDKGATVLTPEGITSNAIADELIINNMIKNGTIEKQKLGFEIIEPNEHGGVDITQVYDGEGNQFGVEYTSFKQNTSDALDNINSKKMYRTVIESDNGNFFKHGNANCVLTCRVYSWDDDITDTINAVNFTWTRKSKDELKDKQWNINHSGGTKSLTITPSDVWGRSVFYCTVTLPDGSTLTND